MVFSQHFCVKVTWVWWCWEVLLSCALWSGVAEVGAPSHAAKRCWGSCCLCPEVGCLGAPVKEGAGAGGMYHSGQVASAAFSRLGESNIGSTVRKQQRGFHSGGPPQPGFLLFDLQQWAASGRWCVLPQSCLFYVGVHSTWNLPPRPRSSLVCVHDLQTRCRGAGAMCGWGWDAGLPFWALNRFTRVKHVAQPCFAASACYFT